MTKYLPMSSQEQKINSRRVVSTGDSDFMKIAEPQILKESVLHQVTELLRNRQGLETYSDVAAAFALCDERHQGQHRLEGTPYSLHIYRMATWFLEDADVFSTDDLALGLKIIALHDTVEDTNTSLQEIEEKFGKSVETGVAALSREIHAEGRTISDDVYYDTIAKQSSLVQRIKVYDRIDNLYSLLNLDFDGNDKQKYLLLRDRILEDTKVHIFPLAQTDQQLESTLQTAFRTVLQNIPK
jgi:(p)ppGpp synthase/HD superfamily hydrolase